MHTRPFIGLLLFNTMALVSTPAQADDWPRWRGLEGTGVSSESEWAAKGKEKSLWFTNVGLGYASFVISEGRVITSGHNEADSLDTIYCLEAKTGKPIWKHSFPSALWKRAHTGGTLTTPTIDGERVYALGREGRFFCLLLSDGKVLWENNLKETYDLDYP